MNWVILIDAVQDVNSPQNQGAFMYEMSTYICVCMNDRRDLIHLVVKKCVY